MTGAVVKMVRDTLGRVRHISPAGAIKENSPAGKWLLAHGVTKACLNTEATMSLEAALEHEAQAQAVCMTTNDFERAYRAFVKRGTPKFEGN